MATDDKTGIDLDLDALVPKSATISFNNQEIDVKPLNIEQFARLLDVDRRMGKLDDADVETTKKVYDDLNALIKEAIPQLADANLLPMQLTTLYFKLVQLNTPLDKALSQLSAKGVELKKDASDPKALTS